MNETHKNIIKLVTTNKKNFEEVKNINLVLSRNHVEYSEFLKMYVLGYLEIIEDCFDGRTTKFQITRFGYEKACA